MKLNQQKSSNPMWFDESGTSIPYNRTTSYERKAERVTMKLAKEAIRLNKLLTEYKDTIRQEVEELYELFLTENNGQIGKNKGGATFFNFDRSIKIEVSVQDLISFDPNLIELAKAKLDEVLNDGLNGAKEFVKPLLMDAFKTSNGKLDTKRVLGLRRYADRVKDVRYDEAMALIDKSIRRPKTREYFRVWVKDETGEYQDIQLNFANIKNEKA